MATDSQNPPVIIHSGSGSATAVAAFSDTVDDCSGDGCSICLEPFHSHDPATVTNCKHEYHLQCILEWSQRSKECPICWRPLVLKDPASQELLTAVEDERCMRSRNNVHQFNEDSYDSDHDAHYTDDSDFEERIIQHLAAVAGRARFVNRRGRQSSSGMGPSQVLPSVLSADMPNVQQMHSLPQDWQNLDYGLAEGPSPVSSPSSNNNRPFAVDMVCDPVDDPTKLRVLPSSSSQRPSSADLLAFSESVKSKFSAASARYKESISKGTRGFKERFLSQHSSVKELGRGVQREMSAGIAGVVRMIERLDLSSKRSGVSVDSSNGAEGSKFFNKGKGVQEKVIGPPSHQNSGEVSHDRSIDASSHVCGGITG